MAPPRRTGRALPEDGFPRPLWHGGHLLHRLQVPRVLGIPFQVCSTGEDVLPVAGLVEKARGDDVELRHLVPTGPLVPARRSLVLLTTGLLRLQLVTAVGILFIAAEVLAFH